MDGTAYALWGLYCGFLIVSGGILYASDFRLAAFSEYLKGREEVRARPALRIVLLVLQGLVLLLPLVFAVAKAGYLGSRAGAYPTVSYFLM